VPVRDEEKKANYENMSTVSADLWRRWLTLYQDRFDAFYYNVRVGAGVRPPADTTDAMKRAWWADTCLRIDAVGERENQTWVIEIAERPSAKILGNLQLYSHLTPQYQGQNAVRRDVIAARAAEDFLLPTEIRAIIMPALICRFLGFDMGQVVQKAGILAFVFPGAGNPILPVQFMPSYATPTK
jgi:hypothetical protein